MKTEFTITKEQILKIANKCTSHEFAMKDAFPEAFESELEYGRWLEDKSIPNWLVFQADEKRLYGFSSQGKWFEVDSIYDATKDVSNIYASKEEVETALINEAVKRGYKEGNYKCLSIPKKTNKHAGDYEFSFEDNKLYSGWSNRGRNVIYENGIWAEIIEKQLTIEQRIERLEKLNKL